MSDRIYPIRASEVVPGMILVGDVDHVIDPGISFDIRGGYAPGDEIEIRLPGPSPRELLCGCTADSLVSLRCRHWMEHYDHCPVRRLRLRLWPVGATWDEEIGWVLRHPKGALLSIGPRSLERTLLSDIAGSSVLRAAFCESEGCVECQLLGPCERHGAGTATNAKPTPKLKTGSPEQVALAHLVAIAPAGELSDHVAAVIQRGGSWKWGDSIERVLSRVLRGKHGFAQYDRSSRCWFATEAGVAEQALHEVQP